MLIKDFYLIKDKHLTETSVSYQVLMPTIAEVYKGHFPNEPISPGVCTTQMVKELAELWLGKQLRIDYISQCKFMKLLVPSDNELRRVDITADRKEDGKIIIEASVYTGDIQAYKLKAELSEENIKEA